MAEKAVAKQAKKTPTGEHLRRLREVLADEKARKEKLAAALEALAGAKSMAEYELQRELGESAVLIEALEISVDLVEDEAEIPF